MPNNIKLHIYNVALFFRSVSVTVTMHEGGEVYKYSKGLPHDIDPAKSDCKVLVPSEY